MLPENVWSLTMGRISIIIVNPPPPPLQVFYLHKTRFKPSHPFRISEHFSTPSNLFSPLKAFLSWRKSIKHIPHVHRPFFFWRPSNFALISVHDVTIATYLLPDLYLPKTKIALFVAPESNRLSSAMLCNVHISSHPLNKQQEQVTLLEGEKLWFYLLNGEGLEPIVLPWKCHSGNIMKLCGECNKRTKFQFYTKKSSEIIPFWWFYIILCPQCDVTKNLICINQNLEQLGNQKCYHNKINAILHRFESSSKWANKKFRVIYTLTSPMIWNGIVLLTSLLRKLKSACMAYLNLNTLVLVPAS